MKALSSAFLSLSLLGNVMSTPSSPSTTNKDPAGAEVGSFFTFGSPYGFYPYVGVSLSIFPYAKFSEKKKINC